MGEFLKRLFHSDFPPHGASWRWDPWVLWPNVVSEAVIALTQAFIVLILLNLAHRRKDVLFDWMVVLFGVFTFTSACTHAMEVYDTWHGQFLLAGVLKGVAAAASLVTMLLLLKISPKLMMAPTLKKALAMDAELSSEKQEKHRMEGQLRATQDRFRTLVEGIKDYAIFLLDPHGLITSWNPGAERITGYSAPEVLGVHFSRLFPEDEAAVGRPDAILRLAASLGHMEDEGWRVRKDGRRFLASGVISAVFDAEGVLQGFTKVTRDITQQRASQTALENRAESLEDKLEAQVQELRASEARLQGFIRHSPTAIAFKDMEGRFLVINPQMETIIGHPSRDILGKINEDLFPPEACARFREREQRTLESRLAIQEEEQWFDGEGLPHYYLSHVFPLVDITGQDCGLGLIGTDITERKQADLAFLQSQKLECLGVMAGGIAHDFNNLLGAMQGNVELAKMEGSLDQAMPFLETLQGLLTKASGLLRQILAYCGQGKTTMQTLNLNQLVEEMTHLLGTSTSKKARIILNLHPAPLPMAADPSQIQQVVMNLVINASESLGEHNGLIVLATGLEDLSQEAIESLYEGQPLRPGLHVSLLVTDNGSGMTPEVLRRIFDPFFTTKFTGRGLGLAAIHGIVRSHQGGIRVSSEPGKGSTFKVLFPACEDLSFPSPCEPTKPPYSGGRDLGSGLVLVVDDEEAMRSVVATGLDRAGFGTLQARDGQEALQVFQQYREEIRLILMDLTMPTMDGEEAYRELRRQGATIPVILSSGFNEAEALRRFAGLGLAGFLQKPFSLGTLLEMMRTVLPEE